MTKAAFKAHLKTIHDLDLEPEQEKMSPPDISAGQLDFVALLSSVGEDVIGSDLNCPEYEISTELTDSTLTHPSNNSTSLNNTDILSRSLSSTLHNFSDQGMLHLVEVESEGGNAVQVVRMDDYIDTVSNTVLLQPCPAAESSLSSSQGLFTLTSANSTIQQSNATDATVFSIPDTMDNIIKLDTQDTLMSDGLITLDTSAISPHQIPSNRKRNHSNVETTGVVAKQRYRSSPGSTVGSLIPENETRDLLGVLPNSSF